MEAGKGNEQKIQWHQGFVGAMHCELLEDIDKLIFEQEYSITRKPLQIDLLIIKKLASVECKSKIGRLLSDYNILEYKSPGDALGIDAFFQALTYACYYKSSAKHEDERKEEDITVVLVRNEYPKTLVKYLGGKGCLVTEKEAGIYTVSGNIFFNIMILTTGSLDQTEYIWLNSLRSDLEKNEYMNLLKRSSEMNIVEGDYPDAVLSVVEQSNVSCAKWKEESEVASFLVEAKNEGIAEGKKEGKKEGKREGKKEGRAELFELLKRSGYLPESLSLERLQESMNNSEMGKEKEDDTPKS